MSRISVMSRFGLIEYEVGRENQKPPRAVGRASLLRTPSPAGTADTARVWSRRGD